MPPCPLAISVLELKCYYVSDAFRLPVHRHSFPYPFLSFFSVLCPPLSCPKCDFNFVARRNETKPRRRGDKQGNSRGNETKVFHGLDSAHYSAGRGSVKDEDRGETARIANPFVASPFILVSPSSKNRKKNKRKNRIKSDRPARERRSLSSREGTMSITRSHIRLKEDSGTPFRVLAKRRPDTEECGLDISVCVGISGFRSDKTLGEGGGRGKICADREQGNQNATILPSLPPFLGNR